MLENKITGGPKDSSGHLNAIARKLSGILSNEWKSSGTRGDPPGILQESLRNLRSPSDQESARIFRKPERI
eukprot:4889429-Pyramimonas_sp.AAC.1